MTKEIEDNAIEMVKGRNQKGDNFNVSHVFENFFGGNLVTISFTVSNDKGQEIVLENFVYYDGKNTHHYRFQQEFLHDISKRQKEGSTIKQIAEIYGVSGSIAMILTLAIGYLAINQLSIPDILANGLTVIIGFYFGAQVLKKQV